MCTSPTKPTKQFFFSDGSVLCKCVRKKNIIMFFNQFLRARCPSIFSSIAIELNVPRDDFSLIAQNIPPNSVLPGGRQRNLKSREKLSGTIYVTGRYSAGAHYYGHLFSMHR